MESLLSSEKEPEHFLPLPLPLLTFLLTLITLAALPLPLILILVFIFELTPRLPGAAIAAALTV